LFIVFYGLTRYFPLFPRSDPLFPRGIVPEEKPSFERQVQVGRALISIGSTKQVITMIEQAGVFRKEGLTTEQKMQVMGNGR